MLTREPGLADSPSLKQSLHLHLTLSKLSSLSVSNTKILHFHFHFLSLVLSQECFIFVNDFSPLRTPTGGGKKLYMSMPQGNSEVWGGNKVKDTRQLVSGDTQK